MTKESEEKPGKAAGDTGLIRSTRQSEARYTRDAEKIKGLVCDRIYGHQTERIINDAVRFGTLNGWQWSTRGFPLHRLGVRGALWWELDHEVFDHLFYYWAERKPAAVATMPYCGNFYNARRMAGKYEVDVFEAPKPQSGWWKPGDSDLFVFVRRGTVVRWLPEQGGQP